jgi:hypothetical protein
MPAVDDLPCPEARPRAATGSASRKTMTGSPRLCLLTETYYPVVGGGEKQTQMLAADLVANGIDVFVMTRRSSVRISTNYAARLTAPSTAGSFTRCIESDID